MSGLESFHVVRRKRRDRATAHASVQPGGVASAACGLVVGCLVAVGVVILTDRAIFAAEAPQERSLERADAAASQPVEPQTVAVDRGFDGRPFSYRIVGASARPGYRIFELEYPSPLVTATLQNNTVPAEYYLPSDAESLPRRPAVICLHILNGNFELERMTCSYLASRGIAAFLFKLPYYGPRALPGGHDALGKDPKLLAEAFRQGVLDVRRAVDLLASRPEIDPAAIDAVGISMGGILAGAAAAKEPRLHRTVMILAGGDLPAIIAHARETRDLQTMLEKLPRDERAQVTAALEEVDPLKQAGGLRDRAARAQVLLINAAEDEVIPKTCTERLAAALGLEGKIVWLPKLGHYTAIAALPQVLAKAGDFFAQELPAECQAAAGAASRREAKRQTPQRQLVALLLDAQRMFGREPARERSHVAEMEARVTLANGRQYTGQLKWARGAGYRFRVEALAPEIGRVALGLADAPWMLSAAGVVFRGGAATDSDSDSNAVAKAVSDPLASVPPEKWIKLQILGGALAGLAMAPELLDQWVEVHETAAPHEQSNTQRDVATADKAANTNENAASTSDGMRTLRLVRKDRRGDWLEIALDDRGAPRRVQFEIESVKGEITFHAWQLDGPSPTALFEPPRDVRVQPVASADLERMFAAMFAFAMEKMP